MRDITLKKLHYQLRVSAKNKQGIITDADLRNACGGVRLALMHMDNLEKSGVIQRYFRSHNEGLTGYVLS